MRPVRRIALAAVLCLIAARCDEDGEDPALKVATWNLCYGFDVAPLLSVSDTNDIPLLAAEAFQQLHETDFPERASAIADRIAVQRPHLVGLQEVALIRSQSPAGEGPAEDVVFDYLKILLDALDARGLAYRVAGKVENVDIELPRIVPGDPPSLDDVRLTDFDVVLAREDVEVSNVSAVRYAAALPLVNLGIEVPRGYVALDAAWKGRTVRFVTTHLEDLPFEEIQRAQAAELAAAVAGETKPVILSGDINAPAPSGATWAFLSGQGFEDAWLMDVRRDRGEGLTWGHDASLRNEEVAFTLRIDLIWVRPGPRARLAEVFTDVWGDESFERTSSGLWPSDHAGVAASLRLEERKRSKN